MKTGKHSHLKANIALVSQIIAVAGGLVAFFEKDLFLSALVLLLFGTCAAFWVVFSRRESAIVPSEDSKGASVYRHSKIRRICASLIGAILAVISVVLVIRWLPEENVSANADRTNVIESNRGSSLDEIPSERNLPPVRDGVADPTWRQPEISFRKYSRSSSIPLSSGDTVYSGDSVGARVSVASDTCLVAILFDSTGTARKLTLFDRDGVRVDQITAVAKSIVFLPSVKQGWRLDKKTGWEVFYVLTSRFPFEENEVGRLLRQVSKVKVRGVDGVEDHTVSAADMGSILDGEIASFFASRKEFSYNSISLRHEDRVVE